MTLRSQPPSAEPNLSQFEQTGFAIGPTISSELVQQFRDQFDELGVDDQIGYFATANCRRVVGAWQGTPGSSARDVDLMLKALLRPIIDGLLPDFSPVVAGFISKGPHGNEPMGYHQDLTHTDERVHRSITIWIPLIDIGEDNGALRLVPGSHRWTSGLRVCMESPLPTDGFQEAFDHRAVSIMVPAGTPILWDSGLVHGSLPNRSPEVRPAVAAVVAPREAELIHVHLGSDGTPDVRRVDERYFTTGLDHGHAILEPSGSAHLNSAEAIAAGLSESAGLPVIVSNPTDEGAARAPRPARVTTRIAGALARRTNRRSPGADRGI